MTGKRIRSLQASVHTEAGLHKLQWDGLDDRGTIVSSGLYMYRIRIEGRQQAGRMMLIK